ncbi:hypothetical protein [Glycomyces lechevalierae]|uniref:Small lipoprotein YifL n=1 Tax=Glycomyces lechevalierae TaxID=256034 RepID=A0ABU2AHZ9_9ACTN|nr:hypothetical protein [Glycomyces lechevalierae]MDR7336840.1 putative small lipoprotein YifL [Glycomyces lechevalierae]
MRRSLTVLAAVFLLAACGNDPADPEPSESVTSAEATTAEATTEEPEAAELTVGGTTVLSTETDKATYTYDVTGIRAEAIDGVDHVLAEVTITVTAGELDFISGWSPAITPVLVAGGVVYEQSAYATPDMFDGSITGETAGTVGFEAPPEAADAGVFRLELFALDGTTTHEWTY